MRLVKSFIWVWKLRDYKGNFTLFEFYIWWLYRQYVQDKMDSWKTGISDRVINKAVG